MATQRQVLRPGKVRRSDRRHQYTSEFLADRNESHAPLLVASYAPPKDTVKSLQRVLRDWASHPVRTQAEFDLRAKVRPVGYALLPPQEQQQIDRRLGIQDWKGS